ncbi:glycosyl hydrolase family 32, partial [Hungatella sp. SL.1.14]|nr:glycosyl hydrolase family 32 [Hungatella sp. SL.1.14]
MHLFYTGNVKEAGDYDYIREGRRAAQVLVETKDGKEAGEKRLLLTNKDYPEDCTLHVRDPKVWKEGGMYHMVLGARKNNYQG